ncbi:hypothetical protein R1flu_014405 [Riccia fluitans]|uniref:Uncharacterized protein n=1 Tax=Riccia fluitans TaxID=41844 RepID=A0ABD1YG09_9MARC
MVRMAAACSLNYAVTSSVNMGLHENVGACSLSSKAVVTFGAQPGVYMSFKRFKMDYDQTHFVRNCDTRKPPLRFRDL